MNTKKYELLKQALAACESSIKLAKQLLSELEASGAAEHGQKKAENKPGTTGVFTGLEMVTDNGEHYNVPENYASKSVLVVGDTLKLIKEGSEIRFKQIEHVKRHRTNGVLAKKEGKWIAITPEGSYKVLPAAVEHFTGSVGDEAVIHLPAANLAVPYAAIESLKKKEGEKETVTEEKEIKVEKPEETKKPKVEKSNTEIKKVPERVTKAEEPAKVPEKEVSVETVKKEETPKAPVVEIDKESAPISVESQEEELN